MANGTQAGLLPEDPITIVGAGPAGLACAIVLARAGRTVVVREWHETVGSRFHGDFQGLENWSDESDILAELDAAGIEATFDHHPVYESTVFDAWGEAHKVRGERPLYYLVRRGSRGGSLDFGLLKQAIAAGVEMREAKPFGGFANFRMPRTAVQGGHLVVGEQAGFQDALGLSDRPSAISQFASRSKLRSCRSRLRLVHSRGAQGGCRHDLRFSDK